MFKSHLATDPSWNMLDKPLEDYAKCLRTIVHLGCILFRMNNLAG